MIRVEHAAARRGDYLSDKPCGGGFFSGVQTPSPEESEKAELEALERRNEYNRAKGMRPRKCVVCGIKFYPYNKLQTTCRRPACVRESKRRCSQMHREKNRSTHAKKRRGTKRQCPYCGKEFYARNRLQKTCGATKCKTAHNKMMERRRYAKFGRGGQGVKGTSDNILNELTLTTEPHLIRFDGLRFDDPSVTPLENWWSGKG